MRFYFNSLLMCTSPNCDGQCCSYEEALKALRMDNRVFGVSFIVAMAFNGQVSRRAKPVTGRLQQQLNQSLHGRLRFIHEA